MKNIIIVVGARPNFMKVAPLLRLMDKEQDFNTTLVHTGQHYDQKMSDVFFKDLEPALHDRWDAKTVGLETRYKNAKKSVDNFYHQINEVIKVRT